MKLLSAIALLLTVGAVSGAPSELQKRDQPSNAPINLKDGPDSGDSFKCGTHSYTGHDIYLSVQRGINLQQIGETRGKYKYPHAFPNDDSKGNTLKFPKGCPAGDDNRQEFPLMNPVYDGGKNNVKQGDERVVYYWTPGDTAYDGNPNVIYCGIMTHVGAPPGGFILC